MERALELAARGDHRTRPNPKVGAVLVRDGRVLAEGYHVEAGGPHAEAAAFSALERSGGDPAGATLYVSLEPCGPMPNKRTPPCVDAVLAAGLARVVVAMTDPHPEVGGRSLERLRAAGVAVEVGLLEDRARRLNGPYLKWVSQQRPYVTAKWAMSLDGKIAAHTGHSQWISGEASRRAAHGLRGEVDAVLVGVGTVLADDPRLTRRGVAGNDPLRVVLDRRARTPLSAKLLQTSDQAPLLLALSEAASAAQVAAYRAAGAEVVQLPGSEGGVAPGAVLEALAARDVRHVLIEGGGAVLASFFAQDLVDRVVCFVAPRIIGGEAAPTPVRGRGVARADQAPRVAHLEVRESGEDLMLTGHVHVY